MARDAPLLADVDPPKPTGRPRVDARRTLEALIFRMRSGCQWNQLPERFPDDSSVHRTFQRWVRLGVFERIWSTLSANCEELGGADWEWQAADGMMGKARLGRTSLAATPRVNRRVIMHKILLGCRQYCRGDHRAANRVVFPRSGR